MHLFRPALGVVSLSSVFSFAFEFAVAVSAAFVIGIGIGIGFGISCHGDTTAVAFSLSISAPRFGHHGPTQVMDGVHQRLHPHLHPHPALNDRSFGSRCWVDKGHRCDENHNNINDDDHGGSGSGSGESCSLEELSGLLARLLCLEEKGPAQQQQQQQQHTGQDKMDNHQRRLRLLASRLSHPFEFEFASASFDTDKGNQGRIEQIMDGLPIHIDRTIVGTSTIPNAGKGLFAKEDYPKGTLLTCYPGDIVVEWGAGTGSGNGNGNGNGNSDKDKEEEPSFTLGVHTIKAIHSNSNRDDNDDDEDNDNQIRVVMGSESESAIGADDAKPNANQRANQPVLVLPVEYMLGAVSEDWDIVALPDLFPTRKGDGDDQNHDHDRDDSSYLGHFANDGATVLPLRECELAAYTIESGDRANAMHQPCAGCHMVTVATRDIVGGEEIFVTYGPEYWRSQPGWLGNVEDDDCDGECDDGYGDGDDVEWEELFDDDDATRMEDATYLDYDDHDEDYYYQNFDVFDDEVEAIVNEITSSSEDSADSPTRGKGFG